MASTEPEKPNSLTLSASLHNFLQSLGVQQEKQVAAIQRLISF